jgi:hypothetical protein
MVMASCWYSSEAAQGITHQETGSMSVHVCMCFSSGLCLFFSFSGSIGV